MCHTGLTECEWANLTFPLLKEERRRRMEETVKLQSQVACLTKYGFAKLKSFIDSIKISHRQQFITRFTRFDLFWQVSMPDWTLVGQPVQLFTFTLQKQITHSTFNGLFNQELSSHKSFHSPTPCPLLIPLPHWTRCSSPSPAHTPNEIPFGWRFTRMCHSKRTATLLIAGVKRKIN